MLRKLATAVFAAALALSVRGQQAQAQKALVYCPVGVDASGCDRIVAALQPKFPDGVDRGYDGSSSTVDLKAADLQHYAVVVVPSLADGGDKTPYALLRSVASRLHYAINGRVAVYSGAPDQGSSNRSDKDALIQNLARWAANGHTRKASLVGLVAFLDLSDNEADRYSWVRSISLVDVTADAEVQSISDATPVSPRGGNLLSAGGRPLAFSNMASYGLHVGSRAAARTEVGAMGGSASRQSILVTYANADGADESRSGSSTGQTGSTGGASFNMVAGSASLSTSASSSTATAPTLTTDKPDYLPGDTVTFTGAGFAAGDSVTITVHEDPTWSYPDRQFTSVADANGSFANRQMIVDKQDLGAKFTATAVGNPSGSVAQATFTDGSVTLNVSVSGVTVTAQVTKYNGTSACIGSGTTTNPTFSQATPATVGGLNKDDAAKIVFSGISPSGATFSNWNTSSLHDVTATVDAATNSVCVVATASNGGGTLQAVVSNLQPVTVSVSSSLNPSDFGQPVTFSATVTRSTGSGAPTGTVQFKSDGASLGSPVALSAINTTSAGATSIATTTLSVTNGTNHVVTAEYTPGAGFSAGTGTLSGGQQVNKADQVMSWTDPAAITYGTNLAGVLNATLITGDGALSYTEGSTSVSATDVLPAGSHTLIVTAASTTNYNSATKSVTLTVNKAPATITLGNLAQTFGATSAVTATTSPAGLTGVAVTYTGISPTSYAESQTVPSNAGSYTVKATLTNANYDLVDNFENLQSVANVTGTLVVGKATATISLTSADLNQTYNGSPKTVGYATDPSGLSVVTVSYTLNGNPVASPTAAGSYHVTATLTNANYEAIDAVGTLVIAKAAGTVSITSTNPGTLVYNGTYAVTTSQTGDGTVSFGVGASDVCTVSASGMVTMTSGTGSCTVTATLSEGANYLGGSATQTFTATKAAATITLTAADLNQTYSGSGKTVGYSTAPSDLTVVAVSYSQGGNPVASPINAGSYDVKATLTNTNYQAPDATGTLVIAKKPVSLSATVGTLIFNNTPQGPSFTGDVAEVAINYSGTGGSTYGPSTTQPTNAGTYSWTATLVDGSNYEFAVGATTTGSFSISKAEQSITGFNLSALTKTYGDAAFSVATGVSGGASGNAVTFALGASSVGCTVTPAGQVTITGAATGANKCIIVASQSGNDNYNAATPVSQSFSIAKASLSVKAEDKQKDFDGSPFTAFTAVISGYVNGDPTSVVTGNVTFDGPAVTAVNAGTYVIIPVVTGLSAANYMFTPINGALTIVDKTAPLATVTPSTFAAPITNSTQLASVTISATGSDQTTGGSNITHFEYTTNFMSDQATVNWQPFSFVASVSVTGTQTFSLPVGVYNICVRATDSAGNASLVKDAACTLVAVYDPSGGFVTGGGWIVAAAESCVQGIAPGVCTGATGGRANFGFVSKYAKGATTPSGNTEFQFQAGNLNFKSTSYQWLVVSGARAQFKGSGTINGQSGYDFILTAVDGDLPGGNNQDGFRIKITYNGSVVFDNQQGATDSDPLSGSSTALVGGSISIKSK